MRLMTVLSVAVLAVVSAGCGTAQTASESAQEAPQRPLDIRSLAINPADGDLYVASRSGLFRAEASGVLTPLAGANQDTKGFAILGPDQFLASGHARPVPTPKPLGLIISSDAGETWESVVLLGRADLHVIRAGRQVFYAQDASQRRLFEGVAGGASLSARNPPPGVLADLAVDPRNDRRVFATTSRGFFLSVDGAVRWKRIDRHRTGLLAFSGSRLLNVDWRGRVSSLARLGRPWVRLGGLPGKAAAFTAGSGGRVFAALRGDSIYASSDGGRTWRPRWSPAAQTTPDD